MGYGFGWKGVLIKTDDNLIGLKLEEQSKVIIISKITIKDKNKGLGSTIMSLVIDYAKQYNKRIWLEDLVNSKYFKKFGNIELVSIENGKKTFQLNINESINKILFKMDDSKKEIIK